MALSRRAFLHTTAAAAAAWPLTVRGWQTPPGAQSGLFRHGVASGDPLTDRVILWTRVTPPAGHNDSKPLEVRWRVASDEKMSNIVARGTAQAAAERDFTVKVDAGNLKPGATCYYAFDSGGEQSSIGRTKTLPDRGAQRLRLGQVTCWSRNPRVSSMIRSASPPNAKRRYNRISVADTSRIGIHSR